jgi:hypothetical protein
MKKAQKKKPKNAAIQKFVEDVKFLGYTNTLSQDGVDKVKLGKEFFVGYHAVRLWLNGENPIPEFVQDWVNKKASKKRSILLKHRLRKLTQAESRAT